MTEKGRWAGLDPAKDAIRDEIWGALERDGIAVGDASSSNPDFAGAEAAAALLAATPEWQAAKVIQTSADPSLVPVRLRALTEGKTVFVPVPDLSRQRPYLRLDPAGLKGKGVSFEDAATETGFLAHGQSTFFEDITPLELCVLGSVAVTRGGSRVGSGSGNSDLELAILREVGVIAAGVPVATIVHSSQVIGDERVPMEPHDSQVDIIVTEAEVIRTGNTAPRPGPVDWHRVQEDQYADIPFLVDTKDVLTKRRQGA